MDLRVAQCLLVSKVLVADGRMTDEEREFLDDVMKHFGLSDDERRNVIDLEGWDEAEKIAKGLSMDQKRELVSKLVDAASADGKLGPLEMQTVKEISKALGVE
jgi:uncharacterized tellurite resistance protein B-like protein